VDDAGAEDDLAIGLGALFLALDDIVEADGALAVETNFCGVGVNLEGEVGPLQGRAEIGDRGAATTSLADGGLDTAEAFLLRAVVVGRAGVAEGQAGFDEGVDQGVLVFGEADGERPAGAAKICCLIPS